MADSVGIDRFTWRVIYDFDHVTQSIGDILTTRRLTRVMRRDYGSDVPDLIDQPMTDGTLLQFYVAVAEALGAFEPRFELVNVNFTDAGPDGRVKLVLQGVYRPRGHLGDFTPAAQPNQRIELMLVDGAWRSAA